MTDVQMPTDGLHMECLVVAADVRLTIAQQLAQASLGIGMNYL